MTDNRKYLLRTKEQVLDFRARYVRYISDQADAYICWINRMPAREWIDYLAGVPEANIPAVIGILCILYIDRLIDIDFNETATRIRRNRTDAEDQEFWKHLKTSNQTKKRI